MTRWIIEQADVFEHEDGPVLTGRIAPGLTGEALRGLVGAEVLVHRDGQDPLRVAIQAVDLSQSIGGIPLVGLQLDTSVERMGIGPWKVSDL